MLPFVSAHPGVFDELRLCGRGVVRRMGPPRVMRWWQPGSLAILLIALMGWLAAPTARAQPVMAKGNWQFSVPEAPHFETDVVGGNAQRGGTAVPSGGNRGAAHLRLWGNAPAGMEESWGNVMLPVHQNFTLSEAAEVYVPTYLVGELAAELIGMPLAEHAGFASVSATVDVLEGHGAEGPSTFLRQTQNFGAMSIIDPALEEVDTFFMPSQVLDAGNYALRVELQIRASAAWSWHAESSFHVDGIPPTGRAGTPRHGMVASVFAVPEDLGDSRAAVNAPAARAAHNVDGSGVTVGVLELGVPYAHGSFGQRLLDPLLNDGDIDDHRDEHALAVAGIIGSADAEAANVGIAPGASLLGAAVNTFGDTNAARYTNALTALRDEGARIVNMSFGFPGGVQAPGVDAAVDSFVNANPEMTLVQSAGNTGGPIGSPRFAQNIISVGALNRDFTRRADFSTFESDAPPVPTLVAPGEFINAPWAVDTDESGAPDNFGRGFLGEGYHRPDGALTGRIAGTSFSAPHVAGTVALMHELIATAEHLGNDARDHRVTKAILAGSAGRAGITHSDGATAWNQGLDAAAPPETIRITRSLDSQLGSGLFDAHGALDILDAGQIATVDVSHFEGPEHVVLDATGGNDGFQGTAWDLGMIAGPPGAGTFSTVDYLLGDLRGLDFTAALTWDFHVEHNVLPQLELRLFLEGDQGGNLLGFDPANPAADPLIASTANVGENVKLIDWTIPAFPELDTAAWYLQVWNNTDLSGFANWDEVTYGLALKSLPPPPPAVAVVSTSGDWAIDIDEDGTMEVDAVDLGPFDVELEVTGFGDVISIDQRVFNSTEEAWPEYHVQLGTWVDGAFVPASEDDDGLAFLAAGSDLFPDHTFLSDDHLVFHGDVLWPFEFAGFSFDFTAPDGSNPHRFALRQWAVPEPGSVLLLALAGLVLLGFGRRREQTCS